MPKKQETLTKREQEVICLLTEGYSNQEVAQALDLSRRTVEAHRSRIMLKLNAYNIPKLVKYAIQNNLTSLYTHRGESVAA